MILQVIQLKTSLSEEELVEVAKRRLPAFLEVPGLVQKYYLRREGEGEFAGVYLWDSAESLAAFRESELAKSIPEAYRLTEPPVVETGDVLFPLRD